MQMSSHGGNDRNCLHGFQETQILDQHKTQVRAWLSLAHCSFLCDPQHTSCDVNRVLLDGEDMFMSLYCVVI